MLIATGCGLLEPTEDEWVMPGMLPVPGSPSGSWILTADTARDGEELRFVVRTQGGCQGRYLLSGPDTTEVAVEGLMGEVRPFDLVRRHGALP
jgi:hypothetical protein